MAVKDLHWTPLKRHGSLKCQELPRWYVLGGRPNAKCSQCIISGRYSGYYSKADKSEQGQGMHWGCALVKDAAEPLLRGLEQAACLTSGCLSHPQLQRLPGWITGAACKALSL